MKTSSAKAKGRNAQKLVRDKLLQSSPYLTENDIRSTSMGMSGVDLLLSEEALRYWPFAFEVKCQESLNIWAALEQSETHRRPGQAPVLCFKRNRSELYVAMLFEDFIELKQEVL